jgi:PhnB protein
MKSVLCPYLAFNGSCKEAMEFYKSILGGELTMQTFAESNMPTKEEEKDRIVHAELKNDSLTFMASDGTSEHIVTMGDNISMSIAGSDEEALTGYFEGLSDGGSVDMKMEKQFWGDTFGMLTDKFGVHWMINISSPKQD